MCRMASQEAEAFCVCLLPPAGRQGNYSTNRHFNHSSKIFYFKKGIYPVFRDAYTYTCKEIMLIKWKNNVLQ